MLSYSTVFLAFVLAQTAEVTTAAPTSTAYFPPNLFLVRAITVDVKKVEPPNELGGFVITHVYAGGSSLKGKTFECETSRMQMGSGFGDGNYRHVHFLEKDTDGLWWLYLDPKEKKLRAELHGDVVDAYQIRRFPITNGKLGTTFEFGYKPDRKAEWKQGLAWAEAVETVYQAKSDDERAVILRRLAATEQSPVAGWAINLLGKVNPKGTTEFLKKLAANEKLSAESHVVLDKTLSRLDYPRWRSSEHWERLLTRWVNSADLSYFNAGVGRLWEACRNGEIDFALYAKILDPVLARADRLKDGQEVWLDAALSQPPGDRAQAFDWLTGYVRNGKTAFIRAKAAAGFQVLGTPNPAQMRTLRALREESTESQVQKALDAVLKPR